MSLFLYEKILEFSREGRSAWLATVSAVEGSAPGTLGQKLLVPDAGECHGTIGGGEVEKRVVDRIRSEAVKVPVTWTFRLGDDVPGGIPTAMLCGGRMTVLVEPLQPPGRLYLFGGGHCGCALSDLASRIGFAVHVVDDRPEWANRDRHPSAVSVACVPYHEAAAMVNPPPDSFVVIMTHGHAHDETVLRQFLTREVRYLGMIGSSRKVAELLGRLKNEGIPEERLREVYSPIGFDIGSRTPDEIAVSIAAQLLAVRSGRKEISFTSNPLRKS